MAERVTFNLQSYCSYLFLTIIYFFYSFRHRVSLCSQTGLKFMIFLPKTSRVVRLQVCTSTPGSNVSFFKSRRQGSETYNNLHGTKNSLLLFHYLALPAKKRKEDDIMLKGKLIPDCLFLFFLTNEFNQQISATMCYMAGQ